MAIPPPCSLVTSLLGALLVSASLSCERSPGVEPPRPEPTAPERALDAPQLSGLTEQGHFHVTVTPRPDPIPFQKLFSLQVEVRDAERRPLRSVTLDEVRAVMPAHNHGMNVEPSVTSLGEGKFRVDGMRFHMRGEGEDGLWVLEILINAEGLIDQTSFAIPCCRA